MPYFVCVAKVEKVGWIPRVQVTLESNWFHLSLGMDVGSKVASVIGWPRPFQTLTGLPTKAIEGVPAVQCISSTTA